MSLTQFQTDIKELSLMQNSWATDLNPIVQMALLKGRSIMNVELEVGSNTIDHKLARKLIGWFIIGQNAASSIYDEQATNQFPNRTLVLNSSAIVTINLWVF